VRLQSEVEGVLTSEPCVPTGSFGPKLEPYDERFGNVMVTYGRKDERMLDRVKAAVAALR
jgi:hypothetical protein